jgi:NTE family protein
VRSAVNEKHALTLRRRSPSGRRLGTLAHQRFSLVLGAGGRPGLAFHAGTLQALHGHEIGTNRAVSMTGTSAGAIAASILAAGGRVDDLVAYTSGLTVRDGFRDVADLIRAADARRARPTPSAFTGIRPRHVMDALGRLWRRQFVDALTTLVPGVFDIRHRFTFLDVRASVESPVPWRIVAARSRHERHVFVEGDVPLSLAVAASCAVPGIFAPVVHDGHRLVDGGIHSPTNADLAVDDASEVVIVLAPSSSADLRSAPADAVLRAEIARLERAGKHTVVFRPSDALRRTMGRNPLTTRNAAAITRAAADEAHDHIDALEMVASIGRTPA